MRSLAILVLLLLEVGATPAPTHHDKPHPHGAKKQHVVKYHPKAPRRRAPVRMAPGHHYAGKKEHHTDAHHEASEHANQQKVAAVKPKAEGSHVSTAVHAKKPHVHHAKKAAVPKVDEKLLKSTKDSLGKVSARAKMRLRKRETEKALEEGLDAFKKGKQVTA